MHFFVFRGSSGSIPREQVPQHDGTRKGLRRVGNPIQLQENSHHQGCHRLPSVGHRTAVLPDHHDEDWTHPPGRIHGLPKEVNTL